MKTRKELKHELLLTFIENAKKQNKMQKRASKPKLLNTLLSLFL